MLLAFGRPVWHLPGQHCPQMLGITDEQFEVFDPVVSRVAVDAVNNLVRLQISSQMLLHYQPMLTNVA